LRLMRFEAITLSPAKLRKIESQDNPEMDVVNQRLSYHRKAQHATPNCAGAIRFANAYRSESAVKAMSLLTRKPCYSSTQGGADAYAGGVLFLLMAVWLWVAVGV
jgi:hypothetical protein